MNPTMNQSEQLDLDDVQVNLDYLRQDAGGMVNNHNGVADRLLKNDKLYNTMKGDWSRSDWNGTKNVLVTTGREDGKFYIKREQMNIAAIVQAVKEYRALAESGWTDPMGPYMPDGTIGYKWMDLPDAIAIDISNDYFGGMPWSVLKHDRNLKAQFYRVVQSEYPQFVCYPGGRLPIPIEVPYPAKVGQKKFFEGTE